MAVEYAEGKVNIGPDEKTRLLPQDRGIRRTKSEFFSDYDPQDYVVFLAVFIIILFLPLGLMALAVALGAHNDNKAGNYKGAKRKRRVVYLIGVLAILVDCLIVAAIVIAATR